MHLIVVLMLRMMVPSVAEPPSPPVKATGELTEGERRFQGLWRMHHFESDAVMGTLRIDDRDFHADGVNGRYEGYVSIHSDASPARIDFTIEDCGCKFEGMTSTGIYYEDNDTLVFAGPAPGDARPDAFAGLDYLLRLRPLDVTTEGESSPSK